MSSTLTKSNAKERCRTCLRKLIKNELNADQFEDVFEASNARNNFVLIDSDKVLQELLDKYVGIEGEEGTSQDKEYPQNVCIDCVKQLQTFETFRNRALDSAEKLYRVFRGHSDVHKIELDDNGLECKDNVKEQLKDGKENENDIFNMLLKDSLMETEAILLDGTETDHNINNMGPDPFQAESDNVKRRSTRGKRKNATTTATEAANKSKPEKNSNQNKVNRRLKKCKDLPNDTVQPLGDSKKAETIPEQDDEEPAIAPAEVNKTEEIEADDATNDYDWQQVDFQMDYDDDSTDNEVLSKKITKHSRKAKKKAISKTKSETNEDTGSDSDYVLQTLKDSKTTSLGDNEDDTNKDEDNDAKDDLKCELDSDGISSESEFDIKPSKKSNQPARKRSAASGRKKGLTNSHKCEQCNRRFGHKITLDAHIRKIHQGEKRAYKCELCDKSYSFMGGLSTHMRETHERQEEAYQCKVPGCDKKYTSYITLQRHVRVKHLLKEVGTRYVCEQCGATFKQTSNLRYHMRTRHPTEEDLKHKEIIKQRLECEICNKSFHNLYTLKYHKLRIHADDKKYECKVCGRRVAKKFMLDQHMLVHSEDKTACKFCGREFVRKYQVEAHIKAVHQKLKPFQCPHCSESFASRKTLRHHIYIHTGEKPYVCDICGQSYRQPTCLKNHRKIHSKASNTNANNNSTEPNAAVAAAATMAVNRNFLNNLIQSNEDAMVVPGGDLGLN